MSQLQFELDVEQPSVAYHDDTDTVCDYCGRDWGNKYLFEINCHYDRYPTWNGMCGTEFRAYQRRKGTYA